MEKIKLYCVLNELIGDERDGFFDTKKQPERNLSVMETRANQIISEAGDNINKEVPSF